MFFTKKKYLAVFIALLFAVHPLNTEAVSWVSARKELLSAFFLLGSLIAYIKANRNKKKYVLSIILFVLAMMSKITAIVLPLVLILYNLTHPKTKNQKLITYLPYLILTLIFAIIAIGGKFQAVEQLTIIQIILLAFRSLTFYLQKFLLPLNFSAIYPTPDPISLGNPAIVFSILVVIGLALLVWFFRKKKNVIFAAGFAFLTITPSFLAYMRSDGISAAADRYAYMPIIGLVMLFVLAVSSLHKKRTVTVVLSAIVILCIGLTAGQTKVWATTETLFTDVLKKNPKSHIANNNIGNLYLSRGDLETALPYLQKALRLKPEYPEALVNMAVYLGRSENFDAAESNLNEALRINPVTILAPVRRYQSAV